MSSEGKQLSRAQKRRNAKKAAGGDGDGEGDVAAPAAPVAPKVVTPEKILPTTARPETAKPKAAQTTPPKASGSDEHAKEMEKLEAKVGDLKVSDSSETEDETRRPLQASELVDRMPRGVQGSSAQLTSNTFQLNFTPTEMFRYVVEFQPEIPPERIKQRQVVMRKFGQQIRSVYGETWFDGTTLLGLSRQGNSDFKIDGQEDNIHVRYIKTIDTRDKNVQEVNTVTNVVVKKLLRRLGMIQIGRSYFYPEPRQLAVQYRQDTPTNERYRLRLYTGFNCSVQPCLMGNLMTIDLVSRVVQELSVRNILSRLMEDTKRQGGNKDAYYARAKEFLVGSTVLCTYNNRAIRIDDIDFTKTMNSQFEIDRPTPAGKPRGNIPAGFTGMISFRAYLCQRYPEIEGRNQLPPADHAACNHAGLLVNTPRKARTTLKPTLLVPELCYLTGLDDKMRSNQSLMKALNTETRLAPTRRVTAISELITKMHQKTAQVDAKDGKLCVELGGNPVQLKGRVLGNFNIALPRMPPKLLSDNKSFSNDIRSCGFFEGTASVANWALVYPAREERLAQQVAQTMRQLASQQQASLGTVATASVADDRTKDSKAWGDAITRLIQARPAPAFILVLNPDADTFVYSVVKFYCTVQSATVSQVMDSVKLAANPKMLKPICGNTLKQILAKLGFQNWRVEIQNFLPPSHRQSTMFIGVDVSHDKLLKGVYSQGSSRGRRSTVGFTASRNSSYHAYNSYISYQDPDTEFITEGKRLMLSALTDYHSENKRYPTAICVFRDGVGDSQLTTFVRQEINLYKEAFESKNITVDLTVIVVQKRVNLRLFAQCPVSARLAQRCPIEQKCTGRDAYHSPMAGTVVDDVITSSMLSDFYLVPSIAPPGATARPTRFVVLVDGMKLSSQPDALQAMTNQMCYQYFNWPGPIRVPACVMYAHKAAYLFGKHVTGNPNAGLAKNLFYL